MSTQPLPELPPSIESIDATVKHMAVQVGIVVQTVGRIEARQDEKLDEITAKARRLDALERNMRQSAHEIMNVALKMQVARVLGSVAPTPARFAIIVTAAFLGGLVAQLVMGGHAPIAFAR